jgi:hypothetical protein
MTSLKHCCICWIAVTELPYKEESVNDCEGEEKRNGGERLTETEAVMEMMALLRGSMSESPGVSPAAVR